MIIRCLTFVAFAVASAADLRAAEKADLILVLPGQFDASEVQVFGPEPLVGSEVIGDEGRTLISIPAGCDEAVDYVVVAGSKIGFLSGLAADCSEAFPRFMPLAKVSALLSFEADPVSSVSAEVYTCSSPAAEADLLGTYVTTVEKSEAISVNLILPAACSSVKLAAGGYAPKHIGELRLQPEDHTTHSPISFKTGGSLWARVKDWESSPASGLRVTMIPNERFEETDSPSNLKSQTDEGGWVRFEGIDADAVHLHLEREDGLQQATSWFEIKPGVETIVDPVVIVESASLTARSGGLEYFQDESGFTLSGFTLYPVDIPSHSKKRVDVSAAEGAGVFDAILPGRWKLVAFGRFPKTSLMDLGTQEIEIYPGERRVQDVPLDYEFYRGRVVTNGIPVRHAILGLKPSDSETGPALSLELDDEGRFGLPLEEPSHYSGRLQLGEITVHIPTIKFVDSGEETTIELPSGALAGRVVDETGAPVANAEVAATIRFADEAARENSAGIRALTGKSAEDGSFHFDFATPGQWTLIAKHAERASIPETVVLTEGENRGNLRLVLGAETEFSVKVVSTGGMPVPGAVVRMYPVPSNVQEVPSVHRAVTNSKGECTFGVRFAPGTVADIVAVSPGGLIGLARRPLRDEPVVVDLPATPGRVVLTKDGWDGGMMQRLIAADGSQVPLPVISRLSGTTRDVSGLAPGRWLYVEAREWNDIIRLVQGEFQGLVVRDFIVNPGTDTVVSLDEAHDN